MAGPSYGSNSGIRLKPSGCLLLIALFLLGYFFLIRPMLKKPAVRAESEGDSEPEKVVDLPEELDPIGERKKREAREGPTLSPNVDFDQPLQVPSPSTEKGDWKLEEVR